MSIFSLNVHLYKRYTGDVCELIVQSSAIQFELCVIGLESENPFDIEQSERFYLDIPAIICSKILQGACSPVRHWLKSRSRDQHGRTC